MLAHEQANFKVGVGGLGVGVLLYDQSNLGFIGYNGIGGDFPGPTSYDGTFVFTIPVNLATEPVLFTPLTEGDFDVADDEDDPNFLGLPIFPSIHAVPEGVRPGDSPDGKTPSDVSLAWTTPEAPNVIYTLTAPGEVWTRTNLNPSGNAEWERFTLGNQGVGPPPKIVDDIVPSIPNGDYKLEVKGLDARNTVFLSFSHPASGDSRCGRCEGAVGQLTLRNNGPETDIKVTTLEGDLLGEFPKMPGGGTFLFNLPDARPSVLVNDTKVPTYCPPRVFAGSTGNKVDAEGSGGDACETIAEGSVLGEFEVVNGLSVIGGAFCQSTPTSRRGCRDADGDLGNDNGEYCYSGSRSRLQSITLEYTGDNCDSTNNTQSGRVRCRDRRRRSPS